MSRRRALPFAFGVSVVAVVTAPFYLGPYELSILSQALEYVLVGLGLNLIFGFAGRASFGHSGFYGVAAYTFALVETNWHVGSIASAALGIVTAVVAAGVVGIPMLRLRGHYLALGTLAFGFVVLSMAQQWTDVTGGSNGLLVPTIVPRTREAYWGLSLAAALAAYLSWKVGVTRVGRALLAIREDEDAARSLGVSVERYVWYAFIASACLVAVAGVMRVFENTLVAPELIDMRLNVLMLLIVVLGGLANTAGVVIAALVLAVLPHLLLSFEQYQNLVYGVALIAVLLVSPRGLGAWIAASLRRLRPPMAPAVPGARSTPAAAAVVAAAATRPLTVEVRGLRKRFGGVTALQDVSLDVRGGEILAVIGPNGAGKSTLVNVLSGLIRPDAGSVVIDGANMTGQSSEAMVRAGVVRTFQLNRVFEQMTVVENILVGRHSRSRISLWHFLQPATADEERDQRRRAAQIAELVGLGSHRDRLAGELSYGQKRLLELGRALAAEPRLLILDEPAAGLHPNIITELHHHISSVAARGTAVILIEHRMPLVLSVSNRILVLNEGRNLVVGEPREVLNDPMVMEAYLGHAFAARR